MGSTRRRSLAPHFSRWAEAAAFDGSYQAREEEALIVAFRKHMLLPLDDCLYVLKATVPRPDVIIPTPRCLQRHGISRLPETKGDKPGKKVAGRSRKPSPTLCLPGEALAPNSHQQPTRAHLRAEGSANDRCHHRASQNLAPLSQNRKESKDSGQYQARPTWPLRQLGLEDTIATGMSRTPAQSICVAS